MINNDIWCNEILHQHYCSIPVNERSCLLSLAREWIYEKPLENTRILFNCHLTAATLVAIDLFLLAKANLTITAAPTLTVHPAVLDVIKRAGLNYIDYSEFTKIQGENFDILVDCGAGLLNKVHPNIGSVELTHTEPEIYENISYPILNIDDTTTKKIETLYGTSDGFIRAIDQSIPHYDSSVDKFLLNKKFVVFGYGKVGSGIVQALRQLGVHNTNIVIIDINVETCLKLWEHNYIAIPLTESNKHIIKSHFFDAFCVVTATGHASCISENFEREDFPKNVILCNMGTPDEWGDKFDKSDILNGKKPINFSLKNPTKIRYLSPSFRALLKGTELLKTKKFDAGLQAFPKEEDVFIYNEWKKKYHFNTSYDQFS